MSRRISFLASAAALLFSGCASPTKEPGIGSFGTRAGYTAEHLATGEAHLAALFDWRFTGVSIGLPTGPIVLGQIEMDGRPTVTGTGAK